MNARQDWLARRQQGIGGSDVAAILGLSPWKTPLDVYSSKVEPVAEQAQEMSEPAYWGTVLEDVVAREYGTRTGRKVQRVSALLHAPGREWMIANIDRAIVAEGTVARAKGGQLAGAAGLLECKTASAFLASTWGREGDEEAIPVHYAAQAAWYMAVTGAPWCDFAVLIGGQKFLTKRQERDEDTIRALIERCEAFWHDHVVKRVPPPASSSADVLKLFPADNGQTIEASESIYNDVLEADMLRQRIKQAEAELDERTERIKLALGEGAELAFQGRRLVTWKKAKDSERTDWQALAEELGAFVSVADWDRAKTIHTRIVGGSRRFSFVLK